MGLNFAGVRRLWKIYWSYICQLPSCSYLPIFLGIETSGICNLRCVMCPQSTSSGRRGLMDLDTFRRVIDEARCFAERADLFGGGEPTLHPMIVEMVRYAADAGIRVRLHTNATRLTADLSSKLIGAGLDYLSFSFDGYDKETYEKTRVNANFEETLQNIKDFLAIKQRLGVRRPYTVLQTIEPNDVSARQLAFERREFRRQFASLPIDEFKVIKRHNYGGKIAGLTEASGRTYSPCTFLWYALFVLWDGTIVPCCVDWWAEYPIGSVIGGSLVDAWNSKAMLELRRKIAEGRYQEIQLCSQCDRLWRRRHFGVPVRRIGVLKSFLADHILR